MLRFSPQILFEGSDSIELLLSRVILLGFEIICRIIELQLKDNNKSPKPLPNFFENLREPSRR